MTKFREFTEAEYRANPGAVVEHAAATGGAAVVKEDGTVRMMIAIPRAEPEYNPFRDPRRAPQLTSVEREAPLRHLNGDDVNDEGAVAQIEVAIDRWKHGQLLFVELRADIGAALELYPREPTITVASHCAATSVDEVAALRELLVEVRAAIDHSARCTYYRRLCDHNKGYTGHPDDDECDCVVGKVNAALTE